jgi:NADH-quinone oxidoreductase subunit N
MTVLMFSLAGVPPMMGFMAKWAVLQAVVATGQCGWRSSRCCSR